MSAHEYRLSSKQGWNGEIFAERRSVLDIEGDPGKKRAWTSPPISWTHLIEKTTRTCS